MDISTIKDEVVDWGTSTFGKELMSNRIERSMRLVEEALEAAQSAGLSKETAILLVDMVYAKEAEPNIAKEVAGTLVTLCAFSHATGINIEDAYRVERDYRWTNRELIQQKQTNKKVRTNV